MNTKQNVNEPLPASDLFAVGDQVFAACDIANNAVKGTTLCVAKVYANGWYSVHRPETPRHEFFIRHREIQTANAVAQTPPIETPSTENNGH